MSTELIEKLQIENVILVESLKAVYHQNALAKNALTVANGRVNDLSSKLSTVEGERDSYKNGLATTTEQLRQSRDKCTKIEQKNRNLISRGKKKTITVILLVILLALVVALAGWAMIRGHQYRMLTTEIKAFVADSPMTAEYVPDSVRYDYEYLFGTKW